MVRNMQNAMFEQHVRANEKIEHVIVHGEERGIEAARYDSWCMLHMQQRLAEHQNSMAARVRLKALDTPLFRDFTLRRQQDSPEAL